LDHVDLLKVDVEGAEYDIILGSEPEAFANVERIIVEIDDADPDNARGNAAAVVERLHELGFRLTQERRGLWFFRR
jgi:hypothetical protein